MAKTTGKMLDEYLNRLLVEEAMTAERLDKELGQPGAGILGICVGYLVGKLGGDETDILLSRFVAMCDRQQKRVKNAQG